MDETHDAPDTLPRADLPPRDELSIIPEEPKTSGLTWWSIIVIVAAIVVALFGSR